MDVAGDVVDSSKTGEDGDPYVIALALQLQANGLEPVVVSSDVVDRLPIRLSILSACHRIGVPHMEPSEFLEACAIKVKGPPKNPS